VRCSRANGLCIRRPRQRASASADVSVNPHRGKPAEDKKTQSAKPNKSKLNTVKIMLLLWWLWLIGGVVVPTLLNERVKNKQSEGKIYVGSMNRAQHA